MPVNLTGIFFKRYFMLPLYKILGFLFFANSGLNYSDSLPNKIAAGLDNWNNNNPIEKTFLHTDRSTYLAGETIWYKAFTTLNAAPTFLSKIVYIDLVDDKGKVVEKQMRPITKGSSFGDIVISRNLPTGNYSLNAYTLWMLNYKPFIFQKNIRIYGGDYNPVNPKKGSTDFTVTFFPEGGDLVEGLKSTVAFYAINKQGIPVDVKGNIRDKSGKLITSFSTAHPGYGKFEVIPALNESFTANVNLNGVEKEFTLPAHKKEGITVKVNNTNAARIFVQVERNVPDKSLYNNLLVVAQMYGKPVFMGMVNFNEDATGMAIVKKNLPPGIMQITVFDLMGNPLAERLAFVNNYELPIVNIAADSTSFQMKGKNKYRIDLSKYTEPAFSIAITDAELSAKPFKEDNILSNLLLTSDIKGNIYEPGYFFQNKTPEITEHLDLVMLTHGWRRFKWNEILSNKEIKLKYPVESAISVSGKVTIPQSTKTVSGGHVDIITKGEDSTTILSKAIVNAKGEFLINDLNFKQKATLYLQGSKTSNENANVDVVLNKTYIDTLKRSDYIPSMDLDTFTIANAANDKLYSTISQGVEKNKVITLSEVKITVKKISRADSLNKSYASDLFQLGQTLEMESDHYISVWQFLSQQVNGLVVAGNPINPNVYFTRFAGLASSVVIENNADGTNDAGGIESNGITYYLNEINVSKDVISTIHPSDIALVKVFKGPEGAALGMSEGGIAIYTKKGINEKTRPGEKGFFKETRLGYTETREFFNPDYSSPTNATMPDNRTTLYWSGNLRTDATGMATVRFYNNDITKKYKIIVQGIDAKGNFIYKEQILQ